MILQMYSIYHCSRSCITWYMRTTMIGSSASTFREVAAFGRVF